ncbi:hypothetical protein CEK28_01855 [Xenophilus sp. AP218F]|nr:hypothetical protein [Chromobacterium sp. ASV5]OWY41038.1 hypothetical protein CEK28_01855 [Xenophilus sp. AP218F]
MVFLSCDLNEWIEWLTPVRGYSVRAFESIKNMASHIMQDVYCIPYIVQQGLPCRSLRAGQSGPRGKTRVMI